MNVKATKDINPLICMIFEEAVSLDPRTDKGAVRRELLANAMEMEAKGEGDMQICVEGACLIHTRQLKSN